MRNAKLMLGAVSLLAGLTVAFAGEGAKQQADKATSSKKPKAAVEKATPGVQTEKNIELTGSYVKQTIHRSGQITDGAAPVWVLDSKAIANSGATDLRQLLIRQGVSH